MDYIEIKGYKSIKEARIELRPINILIGANGSGKSNFISFFEFLNNLYDRRLKEYITSRGGSEKLLHKGSESTTSIYAKVEFDEGWNGYSFKIELGEDVFVFQNEYLWHKGDRGWDISRNGDEANVKTTDNFRAAHVRKYLKGFKKYHFHDTGRNSPFNKTSNVQNDIYFLYERGENLAAFLYNILESTKLFITE